MADVSGTLKLILLGEDRSAGKTLKGVGQDATAAQTSLEKFGSILNAAVGVAAVAAVAKFGADSVAAFKSVGSQVSQLSRITGESVEDASRLRFAFQMTGIDADTAAKTIGIFEKKLTAAASSSSATADMTAKLGTAFTDATGKVLPMAELLPKVADRFKSMPDGAEKTALALELFGKQGAALLPFLNKGSAGLQELAEKADALGLTLSGSQLTAMKAATVAQREWDASLEGLKVQIGANILPLVTGFTTALQQLIVGVRANSAVVGPLATGLGAVAVSMLGLAAASKVVGGLQALHAGLQAAQGAVETFGLKVLLLGRQMESTKVSALGTALMGVGKALPLLGVAAMAAGAAWLYFSAQAEASRQRVETLTQAIQADNGALADNTKQAMAATLQQTGAYDAAKRLGISTTDLTSAILGNHDAYQRVTAILDEHISAATTDAVALGGTTDAMSLVDPAVRKVSDALKGQTDELARARDGYDTTSTSARDATGAMDETAQSSEELAAAAKSLGSEASTAAAQIKKETDAIWGNLNAVLALSGSQIAFEKSITSAKDAVKEYGFSLDITKESGQAVKTAFDNMVQSGEAVIKNMIDQGAPAAEVQAYMTKVHDSFIAAAGSSKEAQAKAQELWDTYGLNPGVVDTLITEHGQAETVQRVQDLTARINEVPTQWQSKFLALVNSGQYDAAESMLNSLARTRTANINVIVSRSESAANAIGGSLMGTYADGAVLVKRFANGAENHVAQIAPAGAMRLWAEPETGGESYIPLSPAKRTRSLAIWRETGRRLGVAGFADGATAASGSASGTDGLARSIARALQGLGIRIVGAVDPIADVIAGEIDLGYQGG